MVELWFHGNPAPNCETLFFRELSIEGNITLRVCMLSEPGFYMRVRLPWHQSWSLYPFLPYKIVLAGAKLGYIKMEEVNHQVLLVVHKIQMQPHLCCRRSAENEWCMEAEIFWDNQQFLFGVGTWNSGTQSLSIPFLFSTSSSSSLNCKDILLGKDSEWNPSTRKRTTEFMQERRGIRLIHMRNTLNIFSRSHDSMWIGPIGRGRGRERERK